MCQTEGEHQRKFVATQELLHQQRWELRLCAINETKDMIAMKDKDLCGWTLQPFGIITLVLNRVLNF